MMAAICSARFFYFRPKQEDKASGALPMAGRSLRTAATCAGASLGQTIPRRKDEGEDSEEDSDIHKFTLPVLTSFV